MNPRVAAMRMELLHPSAIPYARKEPIDDGDLKVGCASAVPHRTTRTEISCVWNVCYARAQEN